MRIGKILDRVSRGGKVGRPEQLGSGPRCTLIVLKLRHGGLELQSQERQRVTQSIRAGMPGELAETIRAGAGLRGKWSAASTRNRSGWPKCSLTIPHSGLDDGRKVKCDLRFGQSKRRRRRSGKAKRLPSSAIASGFLAFELRVVGFHEGLNFVG